MLEDESKVDYVNTLEKSSFFFNGFKDTPESVNYYKPENPDNTYQKSVSPLFNSDIVGSPSTVLDILLNKIPLYMKASYEYSTTRDSGINDIPRGMQSSFWKTWTEDTWGDQHNEFLIFIYNALKYPWANENALLNLDRLLQLSYKASNENEIYVPLDDDTTELNSLLEKKLKGYQAILGYTPWYSLLLKEWSESSWSVGELLTQEDRTFEEEVYKFQDLKMELYRRKFADSRIFYRMLLNSIGRSGSVLRSIPLYEATTQTVQKFRDYRPVRIINIPGFTSDPSLPEYDKPKDSFYKFSPITSFSDIIPVNLLSAIYYSSSWVAPASSDQSSVSGDSSLNNRIKFNGEDYYNIKNTLITGDEKYNPPGGYIRASDLGNIDWNNLDTINFPESVMRKYPTFDARILGEDGAYHPWKLDGKFEGIDTSHSSESGGSSSKEAPKVRLDYAIPLFDLRTSGESIFDIQANKILYNRNIFQDNLKDEYSYPTYSLTGNSMQLIDMPWLRYAEKVISEKKRVQEKISTGIQLSIYRDITQNSVERNYIALTFSVGEKPSLDDPNSPGSNCMLTFEEAEKKFKETSTGKEKNIFALLWMVNLYTDGLIPGRKNSCPTNISPKRLISIIHLADDKHNDDLDNKGEEFFTGHVYSCGLLPLAYSSLTEEEVRNAYISVDYDNPDEITDYISAGGWNRAYFKFTNTEFTSNAIYHSTSLEEMGSNSPWQDLPKASSNKYIIWGVKREDGMHWINPIHLSRINPFDSNEEGKTRTTSLIRYEDENLIYHLNPYLNFTTESASLLRKGDKDSPYKHCVWSSRALRPEGDSSVPEDPFTEEELSGPSINIGLQNLAIKNGLDNNNYDGQSALLNNYKGGTFLKRTRNFTFLNTNTNGEVPENPPYESIPTDQELVQLWGDTRVTYPDKIGNQEWAWYKKEEDLSEEDKKEKIIWGDRDNELADNPKKWSIKETRTMAHADSNQVFCLSIQPGTVFDSNRSQTKYDAFSKALGSSYKRRTEVESYFSISPDYFNTITPKWKWNTITNSIDGDNSTGETITMRIGINLARMGNGDFTIISHRGDPSKAKNAEFEILLHVAGMTPALDGTGWQVDDSEKFKVFVEFIFYPEGTAAGDRESWYAIRDITSTVNPAAANLVCTPISFCASILKEIDITTLPSKASSSDKEDTTYNYHQYFVVNGISTSADCLMWVTTKPSEEEDTRNDTKESKGKEDTHTWDILPEGRSTWGSDHKDSGGDFSNLSTDPLTKVKVTTEDNEENCSLKEIQVFTDYKHSIYSCVFGNIYDLKLYTRGMSLDEAYIMADADVRESFSIAAGETLALYYNYNDLTLFKRNLFITPENRGKSISKIRIFRRSVWDSIYPDRLPSTFLKSAGGKTIAEDYSDKDLWSYVDGDQRLNSTVIERLLADNYEVGNYNADIICRQSGSLSYLNKQISVPSDVRSEGISSSVVLATMEPLKYENSPFNSFASFEVDPKSEDLPYYRIFSKVKKDLTEGELSQYKAIALPVQSSGDTLTYNCDFDLRFYIDGSVSFASPLSYGSNINIRNYDTSWATADKIDYNESTKTLPYFYATVSQQKNSSASLRNIDNKDASTDNIVVPLYIPYQPPIADDLLNPEEDIAKRPYYLYHLTLNGFRLSEAFSTLLDADSYYGEFRVPYYFDSNGVYKYASRWDAIRTLREGEYYFTCKYPVQILPLLPAKNEGNKYATLYATVRFKLVVRGIPVDLDTQIERHPELSNLEELTLPPEKYDDSEILNTFDQFGNRYICSDNFTFPHRSLYIDLYSLEANLDDLSILPGNINEGYSYQWNYKWRWIASNHSSEDSEGTPLTLLNENTLDKNILIKTPVNAYFSRSYNTPFFIKGPRKGPWSFRRNGQQNLADFYKEPHWYSGNLTDPATKKINISTSIVGDWYLDTETNQLNYCIIAGDPNEAKWIPVANIIKHSNYLNVKKPSDEGWIIGTDIALTSEKEFNTLLKEISVKKGNFYYNPDNNRYYECISVNENTGESTWKPQGLLEISLASSKEESDSIENSIYIDPIDFSIWAASENISQNTIGDKKFEPLSEVIKNKNILGSALKPVNDLTFYTVYTRTTAEAQKIQEKLTANCEKELDELVLITGKSYRLLWDFTGKTTEYSYSHHFYTSPFKEESKLKETPDGDIKYKEIEYNENGPILEENPTRTIDSDEFTEYARLINIINPVNSSFISTKDHTTAINKNIFYFGNYSWSSENAPPTSQYTGGFVIQSLGENPQTLGKAEFLPPSVSVINGTASFGNPYNRSTTKNTLLSIFQDQRSQINNLGYYPYRIEIPKCDLGIYSMNIGGPGYSNISLSVENAGWFTEEVSLYKDSQSSVEPPTEKVKYSFTSPQGLTDIPAVGLNGWNTQATSRGDLNIISASAFSSDPDPVTINPDQWSQNTTVPGINNANTIAKYQVATDINNLPDDNWKDLKDINLGSGKLYVRTITSKKGNSIENNSSKWTSPKEISLDSLENEGDMLVALYQRVTSELEIPTENISIQDGQPQITEDSLWTPAITDGITPVYAIFARVSANATAIKPEDWSDPVLVPDRRSSGYLGYEVDTIPLYYIGSADEDAPDKPNNLGSYDFDKKEFGTLPPGWQYSIGEVPAAGNIIYVAFVTVTSWADSKGTIEYTSEVTILTKIGDLDFTNIQTSFDFKEAQLAPVDKNNSAGWFEWNPNYRSASPLFTEDEDHPKYFHVRWSNNLPKDSEEDYISNDNLSTEENNYVYYSVTPSRTLPPKVCWAEGLWNIDENSMLSYQNFYNENSGSNGSEINEDEVSINDQGYPNYNFTRKYFFKFKPSESNGQSSDLRTQPLEAVGLGIVPAKYFGQPDTPLKTRTKGVGNIRARITNRRDISEEKYLRNYQSQNILKVKNSISGMNQSTGLIYGLYTYKPGIESQNVDKAQGIEFFDRESFDITTHSLYSLILPSETPPTVNYNIFMSREGLYRNNLIGDQDFEKSNIYNISPSFYEFVYDEEKDCDVFEVSFTSDDPGIIIDYQPAINFDSGIYESAVSLKAVWDKEETTEGETISRRSLTPYIVYMDASSKPLASYLMSSIDGGDTIPTEITEDEANKWVLVENETSAEFSDRPVKVGLYIENSSMSSGRIRIKTFVVRNSVSYQHYSGLSDVLTPPINEKAATTWTFRASKQVIFARDVDSQDVNDRFYPIQFTPRLSRNSGSMPFAITEGTGAEMIARYSAYPENNNEGLVPMYRPWKRKFEFDESNPQGAKFYPYERFTNPMTGVSSEIVTYKYGPSTDLFVIDQSPEKEEDRSVYYDDKLNSIVFSQNSGLRVSKEIDFEHPQRSTALSVWPSNLKLDGAKPITLSNEQFSLIADCVNTEDYQKNQQGYNIESNVLMTNIQLLGKDPNKDNAPEEVMYEFEHLPIIYDETSQHVSYNILLKNRLL